MTDRVDSRIATYEHIGEVRKRLNAVIVELIRRAAEHDASKLVSPEVDFFDR